MLKGFKDFVFRGNIVDLAVAVVIGIAFIELIGAVVDNIINPILAAVGGGDSIGLGFQIRDDNPNTFVDIGDLIGALIQFLIVAAIVYFAVVIPMQKLMARFQTPEEEVAEELDEGVELLREIRNLLQAQSGTATTRNPTDPM